MDQELQNPKQRPPIEQQAEPISPLLQSPLARHHLIIGTLVTILILLGGYIANDIYGEWANQQTQENAHDNEVVIQQPTITKQTALSIMPPTQAPTIAQSNTQYIDLYGISVSLAQGWTITEINRRPEPTEQGVLQRGHDCADYLIQDPNKYLTVKISPICGFGDGGGLPLPANATIIVDNNGEGYARVNSGSSILYVNYGPATISDANGTREEAYYSGVITLDSNKDEHLSAIIEANYQGPAESFEKLIQEADKAVLSLVGNI